MAIAQEQDGTLEPPVYKRPKDKMSEIIGEFGRWQLTKIAIVFIIGVPGLCHIYGSVFVAATSDFRRVFLLRQLWIVNYCAKS